jgi:hypothetical protein
MASESITKLARCIRDYSVLPHHIPWMCSIKSEYTFQYGDIHGIKIKSVGNKTLVLLGSKKLAIITILSAIEIDVTEVTSYDVYSFGSDDELEFLLEQNLGAVRDPRYIPRKWVAD